MTTPIDEEDQPALEAPESRPEPDESRVITVEREGSGESLVFWARTRNAAEVAELNELFNDLKAGCRVRILAQGPVMAAAVKLIDNSEADSAELMELLESLGQRYSFSKVEQGLNPTLNRLIEDMALESGSQLYPPPVCSLCNRPEPFPTRLTLEESNEKAAEGVYCARCVSQHTDQNEQQLVDALLHADQKTFKEGEIIEVTPRPPKKGRRGGYLIKRRSSLTALG